MHTQVRTRSRSGGRRTSSSGRGRSGRSNRRSRLRRSRRCSRRSRCRGGQSTSGLPRHCPAARSASHRRAAGQPRRIVVPARTIESTCVSTPREPQKCPPREGDSSDRRREQRREEKRRGEDAGRRAARSDQALAGWDAARISPRAWRATVLLNRRCIAGTKQAGTNNCCLLRAGASVEKQSRRKAENAQQAIQCMWQRKSGFMCSTLSKARGRGDSLQRRAQSRS